MAVASINTKRSFATMNTNSNTFLHTNELSEMSSSHQAQKIRIDAIPSRSSSTRSTPQPTPIPVIPQRQCRRSFKPDVSIVLIGMRGTGKSTLAVIASIACRRRIVDMEDLFQDATGLSTSAYRKQFGSANHSLKQEELLRAGLRAHDKGCIIVCNGTSLERNGQVLMQEFATTHPVIHVVRDLRSVHEYLEGVDISRLKDMLNFTAPIVRRCSNYEFYNISETTLDTLIDEPATPAFLTLKRAQRTFLKFLALVTSRQNSNGSPGSSIPPLEPGYPLSDVATELRTYTSAVQVPLADLLAADANVQRFELGSDAFEILVDSYENHPGQNLLDDISSCISKVRRSTVVPIIYHVLPPSTSKERRPSYLERVYHGLKSAPEFASIDLSLDQASIAEVIASRGITKMIGHLCVDRPWEDPFWLTQYETAVRLGCAVVRFVNVAKSVDDDVKIHGLRCNINTLNQKIPLTCYSTGRAGRRSVCFNQHFTPVIPVQSSEKAWEQESQASPLTAREVTQALYSSFTFDPMHMTIIGASLGYTVSPAMHNAGYRTYGMPHEFTRVQSPSINSLKELIRKPNFGGSIIIQPYKLEAVSLANALSSHARVIGAVNTIIPLRYHQSERSNLELFQERNRSGPIEALYGDNTEWIGIRSCVRKGLSPANAVRSSSAGLIIGAGGMARAAVYALLQLGVQNIILYNRTPVKAEKLVAHFSRLILSSRTATVDPCLTRHESQPVFRILKSRDDKWPEEIRPASIILSCIPADPIDNEPAAHFTLPEEWLKSPTGGVVLELSYKTLNTPLMRQMQDSKLRLWTYMDGLDFLPEQAFAQFELFTGKRAPRRVMREEGLRAWKDEHGNGDAEMVQRRMKMTDDQEP